MPLPKEERWAIVSYRLEKSEAALVEAKDCGKMSHWNLAANRLYYAAYYASSASAVILRNIGFAILRTDSAVLVTD